MNLPRIHRPAPPPPPPEAKAAPKGPALDNKYGITVRGEHLFLMHPRAGQPLTKDDALNLAAWLVVVAEISDEELDDARKLIEGDRED